MNAIQSNRRLHAAICAIFAIAAFSVLSPEAAFAQNTGASIPLDIEEGERSLGDLVRDYSLAAENFASVADETSRRIAEARAAFDGDGSVRNKRRLDLAAAETIYERSEAAAAAEQVVQEVLGRVGANIESIDALLAATGTDIEEAAAEQERALSVLRVNQGKRGEFLAAGVVLWESLSPEAQIQAKEAMQEFELIDDDYAFEAELNAAVVENFSAARAELAHHRHRALSLQARLRRDQRLLQSEQSRLGRLAKYLRRSIEIDEERQSLVGLPEGDGQRLDIIRPDFLPRSPGSTEAHPEIAIDNPFSASQAKFEARARELAEEPEPEKPESR